MQLIHSYLSNLPLSKRYFFSQRILLELTTVGFTREEAYKIVQKNALSALKQNTSFFDNIISDKKITEKITVNKLKKRLKTLIHLSKKG